MAHSASEGSDQCVNLCAGYCSLNRRIAEVFASFLTFRLNFFSNPNNFEKNISYISFQSIPGKANPHPLPLQLQNEILDEDQQNQRVEEDVCYGKPCYSNENCCPGLVCVNVDGGRLDPAGDKQNPRQTLVEQFR